MEVYEVVGGVVMPEAQPSSAKDMYAGAAWPAS
jgi:hypothetical protein